jgi:pimeloyl-ACP methyl ester carboxylesterase
MGASFVDPRGCKASRDAGQSKRSRDGFVKGTWPAVETHEEEFDVQAGSIRLRCAAQGPKDGPLILLLHGFPEFHGTWWRQMPALAAAGFRAVAPDLRGYGGSDKPRSIQDYRVELIAGDVAHLIEALGRERADVIGHDWGGNVAWHFAMWHPQRLRRLAILNMPHQGRFRAALRTLRQLRKSWYVFFYQLPLLPERAMTDAKLRALFRHTPARKDAYPEEQIERTLEAVRWRSGPIHYYRAVAQHRTPRWTRIDAPTLVMWGDRDRWLGSELAEPDSRWVANARVEHVPEATHWIQADAPERVNELLLRFLR